MQRLFSTFPNGWPGFGLVLLRVSCGATLLCIGAFRSGAPDSLLWLQIVGVPIAAMILAGFWTPVAASCQAAMQVALAFVGGGGASTPLIFALVGISLVLLGPGAWSIDARLYGRKRIDLGQR